MLIGSMVRLADNTVVLARLRNTAPAMPARIFCHEDGGAAAVVVQSG